MKKYQKAKPTDRYDANFVKQIRESEKEPTIDVNLEQYGIRLDATI